MNELLSVKPDIYCVGECWSGEAEILDYYPAMNCFNFVMSQAEGVLASAAKGNSISKFTNYVESFMNKVVSANPNGMMIPFLSNHDMDRIAGSFVTENHMRMAANLYLLSPGSPVIYYGEEIGMRGSRGGANTDANRRLAMLWGDDDLIGDPTGSTYPDENQIQSSVVEQSEDKESLLNYYRSLIKIRHRYPAIARGIYNSLTTSEKNFGGFLIDYEGEELILLHNTSSEEISFDLSTIKGLEGHKI
jgi:glycosidase